MIGFLDGIRNNDKPISNKRKIINTIAKLFLVIALGTFSKYLDYRKTELPNMLMAIDVTLDATVSLGVLQSRYLLHCVFLLTATLQ